MADADGKPKDVDREFVCLFTYFDENASWYLEHNIQTFTSDPKGINRTEFLPVDGEGNASFIGSGFVVANTKFSINGYLYGTGPLMTMKRGERVRWYLLSIGEFVSMHTPHWHGNVVLAGRQAYGCRLAHAGADGHGRYGSRQSRHLDVPLPHRRSHGGGNVGAVQGRAVIFPLDEAEQKPSDRRIRSWLTSATNAEHRSAEYFA